MARHSLTHLVKRTVDALKPAANRYDVFDDAVKGFHVRVHPSGLKTYRLKYVADGRQRVAHIGEHGAPWTIEEARVRAQVLRGQVTDGRDPATEKAAARRAREEERRRAVTVQQLVERWLAEGRDAAPAKRESSWSTDARKLRRHIVPLLGTIPVRDLTKGDIETAQRQIAEGATACDERTGFRGRAIVRGGRGVARSAIMSLSACLNWAIDQEILTTNPCARVKKEKPRKRQRFLSEQEVARLLDTVAAMQSERVLHQVFADGVRLLLLTGARKSEITGLRWSEVDLGRGLLALPRERSKTGEKIISLNAPAAALLAARTRHGDFVFPSPLDSKKPAGGLQKAWERIRIRAELEDVRIHDLRHSFASFAAASGASLVLIGKALGHVQPSTTARYAHLGADPVRDLAEKVGQVIMRSRSPETSDPDLVLKLNDRRGEKK